jgi:hypothetical protein
LDALRSLALALPPGWVAVLENNGQIAICLRQDSHSYKRLAQADAERRTITRAHGTPWRIITAV